MVVSQEILLSKLEENPWNPNVMPAEEFEALLGDMRKGGPEAIDPILIIPKRTLHTDAPEDIWVIIDGKHRSRAARKLGWIKIPAIPAFQIVDEVTARITSYAKNYERGTMDPYKQAEYFKWFSDRGWTHEKIAKEHRIDRTTVTKVLSLLKIAPEVKAKLENVPYITISHLEPIATAPHHVQRAVIKHINRRDQSTVADIARCTRHITEQFERRERLRKAVATAKFPKCPKCGKPPKEFSWRGGDYVQDDNLDYWSLSKGLEKEKPVSIDREPTFPQSIKTERTMAEFTATFRKVLAEVLSRVDAKGIESISIWGRTKDGKKLHIDASFWEWRVSMDLESAGQRIDLSVSECKIKDHPEIKTRIKSSENIDSKQKLAKLKHQVQELFQK